MLSAGNGSAPNSAASATGTSGGCVVMPSACGTCTGSGSGTTGASFTTQRCGMRLARSAFTSGRPSCSA
jgi:hypothetical protein